MGSNQGNAEITNLNLSTNVTISAYSRTGGLPSHSVTVTASAPTPSFHHKKFHLPTKQTMAYPTSHHLAGLLKASFAFWYWVSQSWMLALAAIFNCQNLKYTYAHVCTLAGHTFLHTLERWTSGAIPL